MKLPCLTRPTGCLLHTVATHQHCCPALRPPLRLASTGSQLSALNSTLKPSICETSDRLFSSGDGRWLSNAGMKVWAPNWHVSNKNQGGTVKPLFELCSHVFRFFFLSYCNLFTFPLDM